MYITYYTKSGIEYARCDTSSRDKNNNVVKTIVNLGRVLDKERKIFRNRERGDFTFDPSTNTYGPVPADFISPQKTRRSNYYHVGRKNFSRLVLQFGDIFFYHEVYNQIHLSTAVDAIQFGNSDTLQALLCYYVTSVESNSYAEDWFNLSYARVLWPNANMSSQRISEALAQIGLEENKRAFLSRYYDFVRSCELNEQKSDYGMLEDGEIGDGILLDSTGLPNDAKLPLTSINNHNGLISLEVRLIYVVQQSTGLPLYYRCVPGNVIDTSTLKRTISELKAIHVNTKFALLDAGYYNGINADNLYDAGISFVTRVHGNHDIFVKSLQQYRDTLESKDNLVIHNGRFIYIQECNVLIGSKKNHKAYGYLCLDTTMQNEGRKQLSLKVTDENMSNEDAFIELQKKGTFMLVSTRRIVKNQILNLYYTRNQVEEIFKIGKKDGKMLPLCIESEATLRGHLLMTFIAATFLKILSDKLSNTSFTLSGAFSILKHQQAIIYDKELITSESVKKMNELYNLFKIKCPETIPYSPTADELKRL